MLKFIYPKLNANRDLLFFRLGGSGLANCLFTYAMAIKLAHETNASIISPTWTKFSPGTYIRKERDKRVYRNLFISDDEISGISKFMKILGKEYHVVEGMGSYFEGLIDDADYISQYIISHINPDCKTDVDSYDFTKCIAVHIRLGDYPVEHRTPIDWYRSKILSMGADYRYLIFSDGSDAELKDLFDLPNIQRVFFGNAISDIYAISKCCYLIGSDSTFSGWGAFLGQVPCVFYRKHYGRVLKDQSREIVEDNINTWS